MADYLNNKNVTNAVNSVRDLKPPKHYLSELVGKIVVYSLDRSDEDREISSTLVHTLCTDGLATSDNLLQVGFFLEFKQNKQFLVMLQY